MPEHFQTLLVLVLAMLLGGTGTAAADNERWYRVELMIFSQGDDQQSELFEPEPALAYPEAFRFLLYPEQLRAIQSQQSELHNDRPIELDEFGRVLVTLHAEDLAVDDKVEAAWPTEPTEPQREQLVVIDIDDPGTTGDDPSPPRPTPFTALPEDVKELAAAARTLSRTGRYRVLFHQSWNQTVTEQGQALPIVLDDSGDSDQWSELQGSVLLYVSRYLHIETNLWRNTDGRYLHRQWRMAPAPLGPPSVIIERPPQPEISELSDDADSALLTVDDMGALSDEGLNAGLQLEPMYPYRHAVLMKQKRRMRSNEVHYIDHPMLGLVIKVTPLTAEDLEIQAEQETQRWPHVKQALHQARDETLYQRLN